MGATDTLTLAELGRATLARQHLLARTHRPPLAVIEDLVGLQSQVPDPPYTGLWSRVDGFEFEQLSELLIERSVTRLLVMRGTVHLLTAADALGLRPVMQPVLDRAFGNTRRALVEAIKAGDLTALCLATLAEGAPTSRELGEVLQRLRPEHSAVALGVAARVALPLVQVPPRGLWGRGGQPGYALAESWLGAPPRPYPIDLVVRRYLAAFGPATVRDCQRWSGLTKLRPVFEALRAELVTFRGPDGAELFDLPDAPRPAGDVPAPVRLIPQWDNLLLGYEDRRRVMTEEQRRAMATKNGMNPAVVLVDGRVAATYRLTKPTGRATAVLEVRPFARLSRAARAAVAEEAAALLAAMGEPFSGGEAVFAEPSAVMPAPSAPVEPQRS